MDKAVCYIRVGPLETKKMKFRKSDQRRILENYCREQAIDIMLTLVDEKVVASIPLIDRLGGQDLIKMGESKGIQHIVTWRLDRLFRNASDSNEFITTWKETGITFHIIDLNNQSIRTDYKEGESFINTLSVLANMSHDLPAERTKASIDLKKTHHFVYGTIPFGYDLSGNQLVPNTVELTIIRPVIKWRESGWSLRKIASQLNDLEIPTKKSERTSKSTKWYASTVNYLLKNPLYGDLKSSSGEIENL